MEPTAIYTTGAVPFSLVQPVDNGIVTQAFGETAVDYRRWGYPGHNGIDYGVPIATSVVAAAPGRVAKVAFEDGGYGKYVVLDHGDGWMTYYAHLLAEKCRPGIHVAAGEEIALSGNSGASTGPHLHFGLKRNPPRNKAYKGYEDPAPYFAAVDRVDKHFPIPGVAVITLPGGTQFIVQAEMLNQRAGPGLNYGVVGSVGVGDVLDVQRLHVAAAWAELINGEFVALALGGEAYLRSK